MESETLSPGVGGAPLPSNAAPSPTAPSCSVESSDVRDGPSMSGPDAEDLDSNPCPPTKLKPSAFPSSLNWDSDSEKETPDEEELQHLSNPHGLAAHSPGSPSSGLRLNGGDDEPGLDDESKLKDGCPSTKTEALTSSQLGQTELSDRGTGNVSEEDELFLSDMKPKEGSQMEEEEEADNEGEKSPKGTESQDHGRDVYTFPGDSDPESPPPAPWAHCTFVQRSRKKSVLLRPFSGLGTLTDSSPEFSKQPKGSPTKSEPRSQDGAAPDLEEEQIYYKGTEGKEEEEDVAAGQEIYTCVECSIYFNKQIHLQEHMAEHCSDRAADSEKDKDFRCLECGWSLPDQLSLAAHHKRHQESRVKILEEIEKLDEKGKVRDKGEGEAASSLSPVQVQSKEPEEATFIAPDREQAPVELDAAVSEPAPAPTRAQPAYRRRFICPVCNFSVRTPQALSNHAKTHNRKKVPNSRSSLASLACAHCAFMTYSRMVLREHQKRVHPELGRPSAARDPEPDRVSESPRDRSEERIPEAGSAADLAGGNTRFSRRGKAWTQVPREADGALQDEEVDVSPQDDKSPGRAGRLTRARSNSGGCSGVNENKQGKVEKVFFLRSRNRVITAPIEVDSDDDDDDDDDEATNQRVRQFLSEQGISDDEDIEDEDLEALKSVERKCPYCPERFHNGIGLANHVRGHLNRVGVSYNVRHFISPEEVKAIERKFSYQKKKKKGKVANFDPDTFSVMHCEFCSAGFDTRAGLSSHARAHLRDFGITNWDVSISPIHILRELFSRRPDLVIPTDPPRSSASVQEVSDEENGLEDDEDDEDEDEDEEDRVTEIKLEMNERTLSEDGDEEDAEPPSFSESWTEDVANFEGEDEDAAEEEDGIKVSRYTRDEADIKVNGWKCEVCGSRFSSRRGMSIHARTHLRQLGVSDGRSAPIELLYQVAKEHNLSGKLSSSLLDSAGKSPGKDGDLDDMDEDVKPISLPILAKAVPPSSSSPSPGASPAPTHSSSPSIVRKAPISSLLPVSSPLRSAEHKVGGMKSLTSNMTVTKPLWAPQESDAPLNLVRKRSSSAALEDDSNGDIVCQLCGAWFETRKGLSSHARAHLRHFGVEYSESKGSPISLLSQLMDSDDFKHKASALQLDSDQPATAISSPKQPLLSLSSASSSASSLLYKVTTAGSGSSSRSTSSSSYVPPAKRLKTSSMQVFRLSSGELMAVPHSDPPKEIACEFCGEYFENRKGLSSHARSHLRQMGITEWSVNGSPIDTLRETITRRGLPCVLPLKTHKTPPPSSPGPPRSPLSTSSSPSGTLLSRLPFAFARPSSPAKSAASKSSSATPTSSAGLILKVKPEPEQVEVTSPGAVGRSANFSAEPLNCSWNSTNSAFPLNLAKTHEIEPTRDIRCDFCGEYFENRKGLSSHARSHLRQMGITEWSVNGSPIDTLREVMHKRGLSPQTDKGVKTELAKSPRWENSGGAEGLSFSAYPASKFRKSPLSLVPLGSRLHKQGVLSAASPSGKFFRTSPLGKRPQSEEAESTQSPPHQPKTFSPLPQDFSVKKKPSPDKHTRQDPSCELCGFYFENRKALASHARAHLRQFGVTEWCVNGSPIETLSAWIRSRPQKVLEMHRSYMQGNRTPVKKKSSASHWASSLPVSLVRPLSREVSRSTSSAADDDADTSPPVQSGAGSRSPSRLADGLPPQAQVARSELNVRLPRGFERRPLKHPSCTDGAERDCGPPKPPRSSTVPALVPKPPSYPLVKLVGKFYTLKCRFCEVEFHGPLSVQEDWIRHLQQHILKMNSNKSAEPKETSTDADDAVQPEAPPSTSTQTRSTASNSPPHTPPIEIVKVSGGQPALKPLPPQTA
ncbi:protein Wiz [Neosynchiropus ocellatus]